MFWVCVRLGWKNWVTNLSASSGFQELSPYKQNQFTYEFTILPDILCYQDTLTTNLYGAQSHAQDIKTDFCLGISESQSIIVQ